eukprot:maker-scaffold96_size378025-snap-gene-1.18 protein:Tk04968 transcript:maker-scaffold96_size378025-snap-gene-1.18-mRNA-1 annotation:"histone-lysine n-methyltransferase ashr1"
MFLLANDKYHEDFSHGQIRTITPKVTTGSSSARHVLAKSKWDQGVILWTEKPILVGPRYSTTPVCLGCYGTVDGSCLCQRCGWPLCDNACQYLDQHSQWECELFQSKGIKIDGKKLKYDQTEVMYDIILPLRVWIMKTKDPDQARDFFELESHVDTWTNTPAWRDGHTKVLGYLNDTLSLNVSEEELSRIFGILYTNDFSVDNPSGSVKITTVYKDVSMCSNSCIPNAIRSIGSIQEGFQITLRAKVPIQEGEGVTIAYVDNMIPTPIRQEHLQYGKHFTCQCPRCSDPTELGTHGSSLNCGQECGGEVVLDPVQDRGAFKCQKCGRVMAKDIVGKIMTKAYHETEALLASSGSETVELCEMFLTKYRRLLHPNNILMLRIKYGLSTMLGRVSGYLMESLTPVQVIRKRKLCEESLQVLDVLDPGLSSKRGLIHYELHIAQIMIAQLEYSSGKMDVLLAKEEFESSLKSLEKALELLQFEKAESFEGTLYLGAQGTVEPLRKYVQKEFGSL